jgi:imidazolonepropionase-like amidohydrolase
MKVREAIKGGADYIKAMGSGGGTPGTQSWRASFSQTEVTALVDEAHRFGYRATLHCTCAEAITHAVNAGADEIQHGSFFDDVDGSQRLIPSVVNAVVEAGIPLCPTIGVGRHVIKAVAAMPSPSAENADLAQRWVRIEQETLETAAHYLRAGVQFIAGSDAGWRFSPFDALLTELELMAHIGLPALQCIRSATSAAAASLGLSEVAGAIRPGLAADLIAVRGRPDRDIRALRDVVFVMREGARVV